MGHGSSGGATSRSDCLGALPSVGWWDREDQKGMEEVAGDTNLRGDFSVVSLFFSWKRASGAKEMSLLLENIWKISSRETNRHRGIAAANENGGICISRVKLLGKSCKGIMQIPDWVSGGWLPEQGDAHTALYLGNDYANYPPTARVQGNWLNEKNSGYAWVNVQCSALGRSHLAAARNKRERTPLPPLAKLRGIPLTFGCWGGNGTALSSRSECSDGHFHSLWVWHQRDKKMEARMRTSPCCLQFSDPREILLFVKEGMHLHSGWAQPLTLHYAWEKSGGMGDVIKMSDFWYLFHDFLGVQWHLDLWEDKGTALTCLQAKFNIQKFLFILFYSSLYNSVPIWVQSSISSQIQHNNISL